MCSRSMAPKIKTFCICQMVPTRLPGRTEVPASDYCEGRGSGGGETVSCGGGVAFPTRAMSKSPLTTVAPEAPQKVRK